MIDYKLNGLIPSPPDPRDYRITFGTGEKNPLPAEWLPREFAIHDQGRISSCAAHAIAGAFEQQGEEAKSYGWIYGNRRHTDHTGEGLIARDALKTVQKDGVPDFEKHPYNQEVSEIIRIFEEHFEKGREAASRHRIGSYWRLTGPDECKRAMLEGKSVVIGLFLLGGMIDMELGNDPMIREPQGDSLAMIGGHMVLASGWTEKGIRIANSWSEKWGDHGYGYIEDGVFDWSDRTGFPVPLIEAWAFDLAEDPEKSKEGWYQDGEKWRYRDKDGDDCTGWVFYQQHWYYMGADGCMETGWQKISGEWYWFHDWGGMRTGWLLDRGRWYYFGSDGKMFTGIHQIGSETFCFNPEEGAPLPFGACIMTDEKGAVKL